MPPAFKAIAVGSKFDEIVEPELHFKAKDTPSQYRAIFAAVIKASKDITFLKRRAELMKACVVRLRATIMLLGRDCVPDGLLLNGHVDIESLEASLGVRSPHTVSKRVSSFSHLVTWFLDETPKTSKSILSEQSVWEYLLHLKRTGASEQRIRGRQRS